MQQTKFQWMLIHPAHIIAQGAGSGLLHPASGTWGTLVGWILFVFLGQIQWLYSHTWTWIVVLAVLFPIGVWACNVTARDMQVHDDSSIVIDEIWAIWLVMLLIMPAPFWQQAIAFALFRLFDIWKPYPIRVIDQKWQGGIGVMMDDAVAALYTLLTFAAGVRFFAWWQA